MVVATTDEVRGMINNEISFCCRNLIQYNPVVDVKGWCWRKVEQRNHCKVFEGDFLFKTLDYKVANQRGFLELSYSNSQSQSFFQIKISFCNVVITQVPTSSIPKIDLTSTHNSIQEPIAQVVFENWIRFRSNSYW